MTFINPGGMELGMRYKSYVKVLRYKSYLKVCLNLPIIEFQVIF